MIAVDTSPQDVLVPHGQQLNSPFGSVHPQQPPGASYHTTPLLPPSYPNTNPRLHPAATRTRQSPVKRFCNAFTVALVIYLTILTLSREIVHMATATHPHHDAVGSPRPEDGRVLESIRHLNWPTHQAFPEWAPGFPHAAETSFVLPVASHELYLLSRGSYQAGNVRLKQQQGRDVRVDVRVAYHDPRALTRATVCRLHKGGNRNGVGIYTPTTAPAARDRLQFEVVFTLPLPDGAPVHIPELTFFTSNFAHEIGDVWRSLLIDRLELDTSNAPVRVESITLHRGSVTSRNGPIVGHFNASEALRLQTSNAGIQATASLFNAGREPTTLDMQTSNGPITASVSLIAGEHGGRFGVQAHTTNGAIALQYEDAPVGVRLTSDARTSNAAARVVMPPAYEGTFEVSTSNSRAVVRDVQPIDPTGQGRRRVVTQSAGRDVVSGRAYWVGGGRGEGRCTVHTSNARASLDL